MDEQESGFVVKDRRRIVVEETEKAEKTGKEEKPEVAPAQERDFASERLGQGREKGTRGPLPEVTLSTFILSLVSSALVHLGDAPDPMSGQMRKDLELAKQTIDIISMLKDKTKGNLTDDEQKMMEQILYDLRMRYVAAKK